MIYRNTKLWLFITIFRERPVGNVIALKTVAIDDQAPTIVWWQLWRLFNSHDTTIVYEVFCTCSYTFAVVDFATVVIAIIRTIELWTDTKWRQVTFVLRLLNVELIKINQEKMIKFSNSTKISYSSPWVDILTFDKTKTIRNKYNYVWA